MQLPSLFVLFSCAVVSHVSAQSFTTYAMHEDDTCSDAPQQIAFMATNACSDTVLQCTKEPMGDNTVYMKNDCTTDLVTFTDAKFGSSPYLLLEVYSGANCGTLSYGTATLADGTCLLKEESDTLVNSNKVEINSDGSVTTKTYNGTTCSGEPIDTSTVPREIIGGETCYYDMVKYYVGTGKGGASSITGDSTAGSNADSTFGNQSPTTSSTGSASGSVDPEAGSASSASMTVVSVSLLALPMILGMLA